MNDEGDIQTLARFQVATEQKVIERIREAQYLMKQNNSRGIAVLDDLFRSGDPPSPPLDGAYAGELIASCLGSPMSQVANTLAERWMPWLGKEFDEARGRGDNIFDSGSLPLFRVLLPGYHGFSRINSSSYRAFAFRTWIGMGRADPDRPVLKIDYDVSGNPRLSIRRILDELVQVDQGLYLGKAHVKWWWGAWQVIAYFMLFSNEELPMRLRARR